MEPKDHTPIEGVLNRPGVTPTPPEMDWRCAIRDDGQPGEPYASDLRRVIAEVTLNGVVLYTAVAVAPPATATDPAWQEGFRRQTSRNFVQFLLRNSIMSVEEGSVGTPSTPPRPPAPSALDDFGGYYSVRRDGREIARFAPGPDWSEYAETTFGLMKRRPNSLTYRWVATSPPSPAVPAALDPED